MTGDQGMILAIIGVTMVLFIHGRWRADVVALLALVVSVLVGLVPGREAFSGFGHPAVITVACVLVLSQGLQETGAVDALARRLLPAGAGPILTMTLLTALVSVLSAFMNNVGALALVMPLAIQAARTTGMSVGRMLMPLSFGSILGGMTTLIGTPPNLIVSGFRARQDGDGFAMFDFAPVGVAVLLAGLTFIVLGGWRLVPKRERSDAEGFATGPYLTEARVTESSPAVGRTLRQIEQDLDAADAQIIGIVRSNVTIPAPHLYREVRLGDILLIEADHVGLSKVLSGLGLELAEAVKRDSGADDVGGATDDSPDDRRRALADGDVGLSELVVLPSASLIGRTATDIDLRRRYGINLLALSRGGQRAMTRLRAIAFRAGDVLLLQGTQDEVASFANRYNCVPLAARALTLPNRRQMVISVGIMIAAIAGAASGWVQPAVAFATGVLALVLTTILPQRRMYDAIDWPVIVLLGALMPVAGALDRTGAASEISRLMLGAVGNGNAVIALALVLVVTMTLSDFMNNAATAAVMCPVAIGTAKQLGVNPDAFLMAVAIGASCAFLTPIGHQNNMLIMGPAGLRFGDYWRLGLPLEFIVLAVSIPLLLIVWPL